MLCVGVHTRLSGISYAFPSRRWERVKVITKPEARRDLRLLRHRLRRGAVPQRHLRRHEDAGDFEPHGRCAAVSATGV